jgi:serine protease
MWHFARVLSVLLLFAGTFVPTFGEAQPGGVPPASPLSGEDPPPLKLAVLLNYQSSTLPRAEEVVAKIQDASDPGRQVVIERLGGPSAASLMIQRRLPPELRERLGDNDPEEKLQRYMVLEYPTTQATMAAKARLERDSAVLFVKESQYARFSAAPSDPLYAVVPGPLTNYQWAINNPLNLQAAWDQVRGTAFLGHVDNGIQSLNLHEDLVQSAWRRFRFNVAGGVDVDEHPELASNRAGHGTHTAGIMAAATSQAGVPAGYPNPANLGVAGVCWYCNLMVAKASRSGATLDGTNDIPAAITWAITSGAQVINLSLGGANQDCGANPNAPYCLALDLAQSRQVVISAASGNSDRFAPGGTGNAIGTELQFPAIHPSTIAVGAIQGFQGARGDLWTEENPLFDFRGSSGGPGMTTRGILAPGREVLSTFYDGHDWNPPARCISVGTTHAPHYGICTGTSMAAPHITGLTGLMRSVNPLLGAATIRTMLLNSGNNVGSPEHDSGFRCA